jgi:hypothetical protein
VEEIDAVFLGIARRREYSALKQAGLTLD